MLYSGIYFRHYKVHTQMQAIIEIKCQIMNLAIKSRQPLLQWTKGVLVMLEKAEGIIDVMKL